MVSEAVDLGASYFLTKPVEENALLDRMRALFSRGAPVEEHPAELKNLVTSVIHEIGVPAHIKGYQYLREAIMIAVDDMDVINAVTKVLYPEVAKRFSTTPSPRGAGHPPRHRGGLGPGRSGDAAEVFRLHRLQCQGQAHQQRVHRHDRRPPGAGAAEGPESVRKQTENQPGEGILSRLLSGVQELFPDDSHLVCRQAPVPGQLDLCHPVRPAQ